MSIWGKILGGSAGMVLGGPLGAVLGLALGHKIDKIRKQQSHYDWEVKSSGVMKDFDLIVATANGREARPELNHLKEAMNQ